MKRKILYLLLISCFALTACNDKKQEEKKNAFKFTSTSNVTPPPEVKPIPTPAPVATPTPEIKTVTTPVASTPTPLVQPQAQAPKTIKNDTAIVPSHKDVPVKAKQVPKVEKIEKPKNNGCVKVHDVVWKCPPGVIPPELQ